MKKKPAIRYLVASPSGDVPLDTSRLDYPLETDPLKTPYRAYFNAITDFLTSGNSQPLLESVNLRLGTDFNPGDLNEIIIRTEKHGALYHPASIECFTSRQKVKFGLNVALTESGKNALKKEFDVLRTLHKLHRLPYIPKPFLLDEADSMVFLLEEWFEGFHEFHITKSENGEERLKLWEYGRGNRFLSDQQSFEIYRQIAMILTLYYDIETCRMIFPWHHAAGDFVAKIEDAGFSPSPNPSRQGRGNKPSPLEGEGKGEGDMRDKIDVRLTTVRGHEPFMGSDINETINPVLALFYFLLHLSVQMRLDRLEGVGDIVWADEKCVDATLAGFFLGIESKKAFRDYCGSQAEFLTLLRSFSMEDLATTFKPVVEQYDRTKDFPVIARNLRNHIARLYSTLRNYP
jgi:hypothetical protein